MKTQKESSKLVKPMHILHNPSEDTPKISLTVFDLVAEDGHIPIIYVYQQPTPSNAALELALGKVLSDYRELAGRFGTDVTGKRVILLNDEGLRFVEAFTDCTLDEAQLFNPSEALLGLHPCLDSPKELAQVQLTRFTCGSLAVGFSANHMMCDGYSVSRFLVAWGQACRGTVEITSPLHDRTIFAPRDSPRFEFEHSDVEFQNKNVEECCINVISNGAMGDILVMHKTHFTLEMLNKIRAKASKDCYSNHSYSMFESLVGHVWRAVARACIAADDGDRYKATCIKIAVNGRRRMSPRVPDEYFGNVVLWAYPKANMKKLASEHVSYAATIIHEAVAKVKDNYFKSFIDFASLIEESDELVPKLNLSESDVCLNLYIDSWLGFPFCDLDFGGGKPCMFMPSYRTWPGHIYVVPSYAGDGSIDVFVTLSKNQVSCFKEMWFSLD
ncbi:hypothetical protein Sjap_013622 [Stephania japonica]|uniref:Uncharacterized protein n=1 Tax=Stephania japonica TaxID=461633 RepID=A0AAP0IZG0_9MAGN